MPDITTPSTGTFSPALQSITSSTFKALTHTSFILLFSSTIFALIGIKLTKSLILFLALFYETCSIYFPKYIKDITVTLASYNKFIP